MPGPAKNGRVDNRDLQGTAVQGGMLRSSLHVRMTLPLQIGRNSEPFKLQAHWPKHWIAQGFPRSKRGDQASVALTCGDIGRERQQVMDRKDLDDFSIDVFRASGNRAARPETGLYMTSARTLCRTMLPHFWPFSALRLV